MMSVGVLWLLQNVFLLIIAVRTIAFFRRMRVLLKSGLLADVRLFLREYWKWNHIRSNLTGFWLGLSAAAGYGYALFLAYHVNDTPVADAFRRSPVAASAVLLGLAFLIGYTVYSAVRQHHTTVDICDGLKALRIFRAYKDSIETVQSLQWMQEGIGAFLNLGLSGLISVSNDVVDRITEEKIKNALGRFAAESAVEFAGRILLIGLTLFLLRGHFTLLP